MPQSGITFYWENFTMRQGESTDLQPLAGQADQEIKRKSDRKLLTCFVKACELTDQSEILQLFLADCFLSKYKENESLMGMWLGRW